MLKTRILSAIVGIILILAIIYAGGLYWQGMVLLLALVGYYEYLRMLKQDNNLLLAVAGYSVMAIMLFAWHLGNWLYPALWAAIIILVCIKVFQYPRINIVDTALVFWGAFYLGFLFSYALQMADLKHSSLAILLTFLLTWASDIGGYFGGRFWGKHKLAPVLSPNKTWEGAIGCVILTVITIVVFFAIAEMELAFGAYVILLGVLASVMAQLGDLFISSIKRYFNVKDTGMIIPGHGGVLDRFDSFLLVVPLIYYYWSIFI